MQHKEEEEEEEEQEEEETHHHLREYESLSDSESLMSSIKCQPRRADMLLHAGIPLLHCWYMLQVPGSSDMLLPRDIVQ